MKCYDFELNISAYIEGELKQIARQDLSRHKESCKNCAQKLVDISIMMENLPKLTQVTTSSQFDQKLQDRILEINKLGPSVWQRLIKIKPFGFEPVPALGFVSAMVMIIGASYFLLNQDVLPDVDLNKLSTQPQQNLHQDFKPSVVSPKQNLPSIADSDTSGKSNTKHLDKKINLVGGRK